MEDENYDRALGGLQTSGYAYLCTLCHATRDSAKNKLGTFTVTRTHQETKTLADYSESRMSHQCTTEHLFERGEVSNHSYYRLNGTFTGCRPCKY